MANNHQFGSGNAALDAFKGSDDELDCLLRRLRNPNDYGGIEKHELYELLRVLFRNVYELGSSDYARIAVLLKASRPSCSRPAPIKSSCPPWLT